MQRLIDDHVFTGDIVGISRMTILLILVLLTEVSLQYTFNVTASWLGQHIVRDLRVRVFSHITSLKLAYFDRTPIGQSTTRTISDIETINAVFSEGVIAIIADLLTLTVVLSMMFGTSWKLSLICMAVLPFLMVGAYWFKEAVRTSFQIVRNQVSIMNSFLQEHISGMRIVQIFNAEAQESEKFRAINHTYTQANLRSILAYALFFPFVEIISAAALGLMVWYGARGVIDGDVTLGVLVAFPIYLNMLFRPVRMLADKFNTLQMGLVAADRVFKLLDNPDFVENSGSYDPKNTPSIPLLRGGNVIFKNVWFAYEEEHWILKNVNFKLSAGKTMAIVGSTGSGKTTITSLLGRFYDIQRGEILLDGVNIVEYNLNILRSRMAVVLQDVFLFNGSVLQNITLRDQTISREKVVAAAKMIGADEFIERLPNGYDYEVMERGATLSMGQRQLISFVRALVFDPEILILDEATSSIDPETESVIQYAIEKLIAKRTSIIIAHRLSTIRHADQILVLEKGEVKEMGKHDELLRLENGHYRELYEMQFAALNE
jgi:ATP-binding cassette subfamily B protein